MVYLRKLMSNIFFLKYFTVNYVLKSLYSVIFNEKYSDELNSVIKSTSTILLAINIDHYEV